LPFDILSGELHDRTSRGAAFMKRSVALCLVVAVAGLTTGSVALAQENAPTRGTAYYTPVNGSGTTYRIQPLTGVRAPVSRAIYVQQPAASAGALPAVGRQVVVRPDSWGTRAAVAYIYPTVAIGQYVQAPGQPAIEYQGVTGPATTYPSGINPYKYSYAAPATGGYYYASAYNSGYYTSGCYQPNSCCRCSRRRCTIFGGMSYGCGPGCYTTIPAPCPTTCAYIDPCAQPGGAIIAPPANGTPGAAPGTPGTAQPPTPQPPTPSPPVESTDPPQPIEKKVTTPPQANLFPAIPGLPPDA
jgi:hypothetical protein